MQKTKKKLVVDKQSKLAPLTKDQLQNSVGGTAWVPTVVDGNRGYER